ncbi:MAG: hypothetical protein J6M44_09970, partial [Butyrivibrio sp.]|nr:hypothetical protein [Butyrivibrio sp.]
RVVYSAFTYCRRSFIIAVLFLAAFGIARSIRILNDGDWKFLALFPGEAHADIRDFLNPRTDPKSYKVDYTLESRVYWGIFFAIMAFQMIMSIVMASFDGDDAYYVVESLLAQQADVMNTILPYTGMSTSLDIRHALAVITMWIAFVAKLSGIHATIVSHSIIPLFFIPLVYLVYVEIGRILFRSRQQIIPVFMIVVSLLLMFGNVSIYAPATFFLMRTWQGKALVSNLVFPMIIWLFLWMFENSKMEERTSFRPAWIMLGLVNMLSGVCSSLGVIFGSGLIALLTLVLLIVTKRWTVILGAFLCIIPNIIYLGVYFAF